MHGPPGTGKTAFIRAVAQDLDLPIHVFDLATFYNDELKKAWNNMKSSAPCIALFEDIDSVFVGRDPINEKIVLTFDALLNCVDGVERSDGVMLFATTNRLSTLDSALGGQAEGQLSRPGRINESVLFDILDEDGRKLIANRTLGDWPEIARHAVIRGQGDTGDQFERRCIDLAQELFWGAA